MNVMYVVATKDGQKYWDFCSDDKDWLEAEMKNIAKPENCQIVEVTKQEFQSAISDGEDKLLETELRYAEFLYS